MTVQHMDAQALKPGAHMRVTEHCSRQHSSKHTRHATVACNLLYILYLHACDCPHSRPRHARILHRSVEHDYAKVACTDLSACQHRGRWKRISRFELSSAAYTRHCTGCGSFMSSADIRPKASTELDSTLHSMSDPTQSASSCQLLCCESCSNPV